MIPEQPTRADITQRLSIARAAVVLAEDAGDDMNAELARLECDRLIDQWANAE